jgi:4,5-dihydroxyphthalate decarboxylase
MKLTLACGQSDLARRFIEGTAVLDGHVLDVETLPPEVMFARAFGELAFDISELSFSTYLMHVARGTCGYVGIPVFPSRAFRHSAIYVRADGDVQAPRQLRGRTIGVRNYLNTAALVVRGLLSDAYKIAANDISWRIGDVDDVERDTIAVPKLFTATDVTAVPHGATLTAMLLSGEIDAIVHYHPPRGFGPAPAPIKRLFADPEAAEKAYFDETGIFPIMHLMGIRKATLDRQPGLAASLYDAFERAWPAAGDLAKQGTDYHRWDNGVSRNRAAIETLCRYAFEQGITDRQLGLDELFVPQLMMT